jgi:outer membrane protease
VSHFGLAIYIEKYLKAKEGIMETQIFHHSKKYIIFQKSSKRNQNPSRYYYNYSIIINLKFQHKPRYRLSKIHSYKKIDLLFLLLLLLLLLPRGL